MKTLTLQLPESINEREVKMLFAAILFEKGFLTSGQAAEMLEIEKKEFLENVGKYGVSIFSETPSDLEKILK